MRGAELLPLLLAALCACQPPPDRKASARAPAVEAPTHYLGESFQIAGAHCRLLTAEPALTEPRARPIGRPPEDLSVVALQMRCEDAQGEQVSIDKLPCRLRWLDDSAGEHLRSTRSLLSERDPERIVFEVPSERAGVPRPRRYDAKSGDPLGARERRQARLAIEEPDDSARRIALIAPWQRLHDGGFDVFLDRLARTLASDAQFDTLSDGERGHAAIRSAAELYQRVVARAERLVVSALDLRDNGGTATLTLERGGSGQRALANFVFELQGSREPKVVQLLALDETRNAVQCVEQRAQLAAKLESAPATTAGDCNLLGIVVPARCQDVEPALLRDALRVGTHCMAGDAALGLKLGAGEPAREFELRYRRGRAFASLDRAPRFALSISRNGRVQFEGQQRVSAQGVHEGRTSAQLVAALADLVQRVGWFTRQEANGRVCTANDDRGDSFDVRLDGRERMLRDREGCRGGLSERELAQVRRAIERVAGVAPWVRVPEPSQPSSRREAEIWMVAVE